MATTDPDELKVKTGRSAAGSQFSGVALMRQCSMRQLLAILVVVILPAAADAPKSCGGLSVSPLEKTTITSAELVAAGTFTPPAGQQGFPGADGYKQVPAFCRVRADLHPSKDSDIKIEVWMPTSAWNGKYQGQGNGGFAGTIDYVRFGRRRPSRLRQRRHRYRPRRRRYRRLLGPGTSRENR